MAKKFKSLSLEDFQTIRAGLPEGNPLANATEPVSTIEGITYTSREQYDRLLENEHTGTHNPNPFDFVFFPSEPAIFSQEEFEIGQKLYSGYLDIKLTALTPVHIVGKQSPDKPGHTIKESHFYKEGNNYCIPGSSLRGMLRGFIETISRGWVSQAQEKTGNDAGKPAYPKVYGGDGQARGRHVGFDSYNTHEGIQPGIPPAFRPDMKKGLDVASYLFGLITANGKGRARQGKVVIEDAIIPDDKTYWHDYDMIDIHEINFLRQESPFMGGAHPSVSNWWYMIPKEIWERHTDNGYHIAEFIGEGFWGRKFYFHQSPEKCLEYYLNTDHDPGKWQPGQRHQIYKFKISCLDKLKMVPFRIYVDRLPETMLKFLCLALSPGNTIRHKLGYGKQYGYGSIDLSIKSAEVRDVSSPLDLEKTGQWNMTPYTLPTWSSLNDLRINDKPFIDNQVVNALAMILGWDNVIEDPSKNILCTYPPFKRNDFQTPIPFPVFKQCAQLVRLSQLPPPRSFTFPVTTEQALNIARYFWDNVSNYDQKRTIHFLLYQARAKGYRDIIMQRKP